MASTATAQARPERDRPRSYRGQDLDGADFRSADIRGFDFSGASLRGADLRGARAGRPALSNLLAVASALAVSVLLGAAAGLAGRILQRMVGSDDPGVRVVGVLIAASLAVIMVSSLWKGIAYAVRHTLPPIAAIAVIGGGIVLATGTGTGIGALAMLAFLAVTVAFVALGALARAVAGTTHLLLFVVAAVSGAVAGRVVGGGLVAAAVAIASAIIGRRALTGSGAYPVLVRETAELACLGGTRFRGADLTDARFDDAHLESTDFRGAVLADTHFDGATIRQCAFDEPSRPRRPPDELGR